MMHEKSPVFVKIDEYKKVLSKVDKIKKQVGDLRKIIAEIKETRSQEETELLSWEDNLDEVERQITYVDKTIFEPEA